MFQMAALEGMKAQRFVFQSFFAVALTLCALSALALITTPHV